MYEIENLVFWGFFFVFVNPLWEKPSGRKGGIKYYTVMSKYYTHPNPMLHDII